MWYHLVLHLQYLEHKFPISCGTPNRSYGMRAQWSLSPRRTRVCQQFYMLNFFYVKSSMISCPNGVLYTLHHITFSTGLLFRSTHHYQSVYTITILFFNTSLLFCVKDSYLSASRPPDSPAQPILAG